MLHTFPPPASAVVKNQVILARPDASGNPPDGYEWLGAVAADPNASYNPLDTVTDGGFGHFPVLPGGFVFEDTTVRHFQSGSGPTLELPVGFTLQRVAAVHLEGTPDAPVAMVVLLLSTTPSVAAQRYEFDEGTSTWSLVAEDVETTATLGVTLPENYSQAFLSLEGYAIVRSWGLDNLFPQAYLAVNLSSAALVVVTAVGSLANSASVGRFLATNGNLAVATSNYDNINGYGFLDKVSRARLYSLTVVDSSTLELSATAAAFGTSFTDRGSTAGFTIPAEPIVAFAYQDDTVLQVTAMGVFACTAVNGAIVSRQVAGVHPLVLRSPAGDAGWPNYPHNFASFQAAACYAGTTTVQLFGAVMTGAGDGLTVDMATFLEKFVREAVKV